MDVVSDFVQQCSDVKPLARGGQKLVYSALHPQFGRVVIKLGTYGRITSLERIQREVSLLSALSCKYYPVQHCFLIDPLRQQFLIVEEQLSAIELAAAMHLFQSDADVLLLLQHLVCGLSVLWNKNVVHRDIKPTNILITSSKEPRIIDLGIARFLDESSLTESYAAHGPATPAYAAPEQLLNKKTMINFRADLFVLGILVSEMLLGFHPFDARYVKNKRTIVENIIAGNRVSPRSSCPVLTSFVERVLKARPYERFRTIPEVLHHLNMDSDSC